MFSCSPKNHLEPVNGFEPERYLGKWYEIARLPNSFEKGLEQVTAEYSFREDGKIKVLNSGVKEESGEKSQSIGKAKFKKDQGTAWLRVSFFGPFYADYKVVILEENYQHAVVASSNFKYLWILAREPKIEQTLLDSLVTECAKMGFDTEQLIFTKQI